VAFNFFRKQVLVYLLYKRQRCVVRSLVAMNWSAVYLLLTMVLFSAKVVQPIGLLSKHVDFQIAKCMDNSQCQTIISTLQRHVICIKDSLGRCLNFHEQPTSDKLVSIPICGVLNSISPMISTYYRIQVYHQFALYMRFLNFHLPTSYRCRLYRLDLVFEDLESLTQKVSDVPTLTYCGKRAPWNVTSRLSTAMLISDCYSGWAVVPKGFTFVVYYEAMDVMRTNIKVVHHFMEYENYTTHIVQFWNVRVSLIDTGLEALETVTFRNDVGTHTCLTFNRTGYLLTIYDGPGSRSPTLYKGLAVTHFCFTSFLGYVEIESNQMITGEKRDYIEHAYEISVNDTLRIVYESTKVITLTSSTTLCKQHLTNDSIGFTVSSAIGKTVFCNWFLEVDENIDEIHFRRFNYKGYNMLNNLVKEDQWSTQQDYCQYGGLFMKLNNKHDSWYFPNICNTIRRNTILPIPMFSYHSIDYVETITPYAEYNTHIQIMFAMFPGYSEGQVFIEFKRSGCNDNYLWSNDYYPDISSLGKLRYNLMQKAQTCSRMIVTQNVGFDKYMFCRDCFYRFNDAIPLLIQEKTVFQGMVVMRITNTIVTFIPTPIHGHISSYYDLLVHIKTLFDFPRVLTDELSVYKVPSSYSITLHLAHITGLNFTGNSTELDHYSRYVVGHIIQYLICENPLVEYQMDHTNSNVSIFMSSDFQDNNYYLRNNVLQPEICTTRIMLNRACHTPSYSVRIEVMPLLQRRIYEPVKLIISKLSSTNCSLNCSVLNVTYTGIILHFRGFVYYNHSVAESVWRDVKYIEHTVYNRRDGFSLQINSTIHRGCNCENQCGVVLQIVNMKNDTIPDYADGGQQALKTLQAGQLKLSSWLDAAAECRRQNYNLMTLMPFTIEQIQNFAMANYFDDTGHHRLGDVIFIGLYKTNTVRGVVY